MSRPSSYTEEMAAQAEALCRLGATDQDLAEFFGVSIRTISRWQTQYEAFCRALKEGKSEADARVERSLYQRAVGYSHDAVKILQDKGSPVIVPYTEHCPPDTTACIFWLKNRRPDLWREKVLTEVSGPDGGPIPTQINVNFVKAGG
jgi:hypothetical protein